MGPQTHPPTILGRHFFDLSYFIRPVNVASITDLPSLFIDYPSMAVRI